MIQHLLRSCPSLVRSAARLGALMVAVLSFSGGPLLAATPPDGATISIELAPLNPNCTAAGETVTTAAAQALAARGFTVLEGSGHAAYVARLTLRCEEVGTARAKVHAGGGGVLPGGGPGVGAGLTVPLGTSRSAPVPLQRTTLALQIRRRGDQGVVWHGAAVTVRPSSTATGLDGRAVADLSEAVLRDYPAEHAEVVGVP